LRAQLVAAGISIAAVKAAAFWVFAALPVLLPALASAWNLTRATAKA
jgi:hypothetical protein